MVDSEKCLELDANWTKGFTRKGDALNALGRNLDAHNAYNSGLRIAPNDKNLIEKCELAQRAIRNASEPRQTATRNKTALDHVQAFARMIIIISVFFYVLPLGRSITSLGYKSFVFASIGTLLISLYRAHGLPQFNMSYVQRILPDPTTMYVLLKTNK